MIFRQLTPRANRYTPTHRHKRVVEFMRWSHFFYCLEACASTVWGRTSLGGCCRDPGRSTTRNQLKASKGQWRECLGICRDLIHRRLNSPRSVTSQRRTIDGWIFTNEIKSNVLRSKNPFMMTPLHFYSAHIFDLCPVEKLADEVVIHTLPIVAQVP